jgi:hypothetical protein
MRRIEHEGLQDDTVDRPRPRAGRRHEDKRGHDRR